MLLNKGEHPFVEAGAKFANSQELAALIHKKQLEFTNPALTQ
jgi:hypothetical protein